MPTRHRFASAVGVHDRRRIRQLANCVRRRTGFAKFSQAPVTPAHSEQVHNPGANPDRTNCGLEVGREALVNENAEMGRGDGRER